MYAGDVLGVLALAVDGSGDGVGGWIGVLLAVGECGVLVAEWAV